MHGLIQVQDRFWQEKMYSTTKGTHFLSSSLSNRPNSYQWNSLEREDIMSYSPVCYTSSQLNLFLFHSGCWPDVNTTKVENEITKVVCCALGFTQWPFAIVPSVKSRSLRTTRENCGPI